MTEWEEVDVPRGAFISWGSQPGQSVTGKVLDFDIVGGTDYNGKICPQMSLELTEPAVSISEKTNTRTDHAAGELVVLNGGQASLKRALRAADPHPGDLVKITLSGTVPSAKGNVKEFSIKIARGAGQVQQAPQQFAPPQQVQPPWQAQQYQPQQAQPPF